MKKRHLLFIFFTFLAADIGHLNSIYEGVAGVIGNVISQITGATDKSGFKGLQGQFARHSLMSFNADIGGASARFTRVDSGKSVDVTYNPNSIKPNPQMMPLMQKALGGMASEEEKREFQAMWQKRVEYMITNPQHWDNIAKIIKES